MELALGIISMKVNCWLDIFNMIHPGWSRYQYQDIKRIVIENNYTLDTLTPKQMSWVGLFRMKDHFWYAVHVCFIENQACEFNFEGEIYFPQEWRIRSYSEVNCRTLRQTLNALSNDTSLPYFEHLLSLTKEKDKPRIMELAQPLIVLRALSCEDQTKDPAHDFKFAY